MKTVADRWRDEAKQVGDNIPGHNETSSIRLDACARWLEECANDYDRHEREWEQTRTNIETENERLRDALQRVLPMAEAWFRRSFDPVCHHEPGECTCDAAAHAKVDINMARRILEGK
jgi:hypothetical protein